MAKRPPGSRNPHHRRAAAQRQAAATLLLLLILCIAPLGLTPLLAQSEDTAETPATNLSLSGAASDPRVVPNPDGTLRVFWWDRFDGVTMAEGQPGAWSPSVATPLAVVETTDADTDRSVPIAAMPHIAGDRSGTAHAIWSGSTDRETGASPLLYARMGANSTTWSTPRSMAFSAVDFALAEDPFGGLHLVYLRDLDTTAAPAGVYYRQSTDSGETWSSAVAIHTSRYYRLLNANDASISVTADTAGTIFGAWYDPNLGHIVLSSSTDAGSNWAEPVRLGDPNTGPQQGRLVLLAGESGAQAWFLWEVDGFGAGCSVRQAQADALVDDVESNAELLEGPAICPLPEPERFLPLNEEQTLLAGEGNGGIAQLAVWNGAQWSEPLRLRLDFEDQRRQAPVYLSDLHTGLTAGVAEDETAAPEAAEETVLVFVGTDVSEDVWALLRPIGPLEAVFASPPPWSVPTAISDSPTEPGMPAVVASAEGGVHVLWSEPESATQVTPVLWYARWEQERWSRAVIAPRSPEGGARDPALALAGGHLHAVWSGGPYGQVWYSRAFVRDGASAASWLDPQPLSSSAARSDSGIASKPIIVAAADTLHVVYAVPVNEQRGIYYARSDDNGETWDAPVAVFDAAGAGWAAVDHPRLAVDVMGGLHVVWTRPALAADAPAQGLSYARSDDGGESWSAALTAFEGATAWPEVKVNGLNQVHLLWQAADRGVWWQRWLPDAAETESGTDEWDAWSRDAQIVGLRDVVGPVAALADGDGRLHLVGTRAGDSAPAALVHVTWDGEAWEPQETLTLEVAPGGAGPAAALQPEAGRLDVIFGGRARTLEAAAPSQLWHTSRAVAPAAAVTMVVPVDPVAATPTPEPTSTPVATPTPDLRTGPAPVANQSSLPIPASLPLAGGLAALIVAGGFGARLLWSRRERRGRTAGSVTQPVARVAQTTWLNRTVQTIKDRSDWVTSDVIPKIRQTLSTVTSNVALKITQTFSAVSSNAAPKITQTSSSVSGSSAPKITQTLSTVTSRVASTIERICGTVVSQLLLAIQGPSETMTIHTMHIPSTTFILMEERPMAEMAPPETKIRQYILENFLYTRDEDKLKNSDSFLEQGIVDSTGILELLMFVEETFGIEVDDEEVVPDNFDSVERLAHYVQTKKEAAAARVGA